MSDEDELVQRARAGFEELCRALNMDEEAGSEAWRTYESISRNFTLEVKQASAPVPPPLPAGVGRSSGTGAAVAS